MTTVKFEKMFPKLDDKIDFLKKFDLLNLQKAGKIGNISSKKMVKKNQAIKSILAFDTKNKFLICKTIFNNPLEYSKDKIDDNYIFKTMEWNQYELDNKKTREWSLISDDMQPVSIIKNEQLEKEIIYEKKNNDINSKNSFSDDEIRLTTEIDPTSFNVANLFHSTQSNDIHFNSQDIQNVKLNNKNQNNKKIIHVKKAKTIKPTRKPIDNFSSIFLQSYQQSTKVKKLLERYDQAVKDWGQVKLKYQIQKHYERALQDLVSEKKFYKYLRDLNNQTKTTQYNEKKQPLYSSLLTPKYTNSISKNRAVHELNRLSNISHFEYKEDGNNEKILIFKGK